MLESFLHPLSPDLLFSSDQLPGSLVNHMRFNSHSFPDLEEVKVAIVGVVDERLSGINAGSAAAADSVRKELYRLMKPKTWMNTADLGNVVAGDSIEDTRFALQTVLNELNERNICVIVIGGDENLAINQFHALKDRSLNLEIVYCGRKINLRDGDWINKLIVDASNRLFNLTAIGYQTYLTEQDSLDAMERLFFDSIRLGTLRSKLVMAEPHYRSAHLAVFDCGVIRASEFPGAREASPNGLFNEEACQLARYAGLSQNCMGVGFYNFIHHLDQSEVSSRQVAQMIWYFLEAFPQRRNEEPKGNELDYFITYRMAMKNSHEIVFYKSMATDRWWMEIPHPKKGLQNTLPLVVPCDYDDYLVASGDELPDRWWRFYQKYSL
jgi:formiminoglutamase